MEEEMRQGMMGADVQTSPSRPEPKIGRASCRERV